MPRKIGVIMDFRYYPHSELAAFSQFVHDRMAGNADFPAPDVPLATLQQLITDLMQALEAAASGDVVAATLLKKARAALQSAMLRQARYVNHTAYDDAVKITGSGFKPSSGQKLSAPKPDAPFIQQFQVEPHGMARLRASSVKHARSYMAVVEPAANEATPHMAGSNVVQPAGMAAVCGSIQRKMHISGLQSGVRYRVRVYAVGTAGVSAGSNAVEFIAQ